MSDNDGVPRCAGRAAGATPCSVRRTGAARRQQGFQRGACCRLAAPTRVVGTTGAQLRRPTLTVLPDVLALLRVAACVLHHGCRGADCVCCGSREAYCCAKRAVVKLLMCCAGGRGLWAACVWPETSLPGSRYTSLVSAARGWWRQWHAGEDATASDVHGGAAAGCLCAWFARGRHTNARASLKRPAGDTTAGSLDGQVLQAGGIGLVTTETHTQHQGIATCSRARPMARTHGSSGTHAPPPQPSSWHRQTSSSLRTRSSTRVPQTHVDSSRTRGEERTCVAAHHNRVHWRHNIATQQQQQQHGRAATSRRSARTPTATELCATASLLRPATQSPTTCMLAALLSTHACVCCIVMPSRARGALMRHCSDIAVATAVLLQQWA
jgi:hypothetical protein